MDRFFGLEKNRFNAENVKLLTTALDNAEIALIRSILEGEKIPYAMRERGSGSSVRLITGFSVFGTDFYVPADCYETALALISPTDEILEEEGDGIENAESEEN